METGEVNLKPRDAFSLELLIEEGLLIGRILNHFERFPESSPHLILTAIPFLAIAEHDAIPFLNRKMNFNLPAEDSRITSTRHMTKSLGSRGFDFPEYANQAHDIIEELNGRFYAQKGPSKLLVKPFQTNVGISFYDGIPIYSNYSTTHLLTKDQPNMLGRPDHKFENEMGFEIGASGAVLLAIANKFEPNPAAYQTNEFAVRSNDFKYDALIKPLKNKGIDDVAVFFFFSELLMLLTSVIALRNAGFLRDAVWLKYSSLTLHHAWRAIDCFSAFARRQKSEEMSLTPFVNEVGRLLDRNDKKFIQKSRPLRNAMIHYDFTSKLVPDEIDGSNPWTVMEAATHSSVGIPVYEYGIQLFQIRDKLIQSISNLIAFPDFDSSKQPRW